MNFCKDCKWFEDAYIRKAHGLCAHPSNGINPVTGENWRVRCLEERAVAAVYRTIPVCGPSGLLFEPKDPQ